MADQSRERIFGFKDDPPTPVADDAEAPSAPKRRPSKDPAAQASAELRAKREESDRAAVAATKAKRWREYVTVAVIVAVCGSFAAYMAIRQNAEQRAEKSAFEAAVGEYLFTPVEPGPGVARPRAGKVVLVDMDKRAFDPFHQSISEEIRAQTPEEVVMIAQVRYTRREVGRFEMGARAIEQSCTMTLVDRATRTVIASRSFSWGSPPKRIPRGGGKEDVTGPPPLQEIKAFVTGLQ